MKRILVIANNLNQASYRLRVAALIEPLRGRGFDLDVQVRPRNIFGAGGYCDARQNMTRCFFSESCSTPGMPAFCGVVRDEWCTTLMMR